MIIGNSGCQIKIDNNILTKTSANIAYNNRLLNQMNKQKLFNKKIFNTPEVISNYINNDLFSFEMKYINGYDAIEFFNISGICEVDFFINKVYEYFNSFKNECEYVPVEILDKKVNTILYNDNNLMEKYNSIKSDVYVPLENCHGDFTLSNMIFYNNDIYLIDFLDTFIESPIQDMIKLKQDIEFLYFLKLSEKSNLKINIICDYLNSHITNFFNDFDYYKKYYKIFQFINILRIIPYCKSIELLHFLKKILYSL